MQMRHHVAQGCEIDFPGVQALAQHGLDAGQYGHAFLPQRLWQIGPFFVVGVADQAVKSGKVLLGA